MKSKSADKIVEDVLQQLTAKRKALGLSKRKLALSSGLDPKTITLLERGERNPTLWTLLVISEVLQINLSDYLSTAYKNQGGKRG